MRPQRGSEPLVTDATQKSRRLGAPSQRVACRSCASEALRASDSATGRHRTGPSDSWTRVASRCLERLRATANGRNDAARRHESP